MCHRESHTAPRDGTAQEGSLTPVTFVGSYPTADFRLAPTLPELAIVGRSNVGKSSLLNALVGRKALARTSQTPGKTQMCTVYDVGDSSYLVDLPGYGYAHASHGARARFRALLHTYLTTREPLAGVLWLLDMRRDPSTQDLAMGDLLATRGVPVLVVLTKSDKISRAGRRDRTHAIAHQVGVPEDQCVVTSAHRKEGIDSLRASVEDLLSRAAPHPGTQ